MTVKTPEVVTATATKDEDPELRRRVRSILDELDATEREEKAIATRAREQARSKTMADLAEMSEADVLGYLARMEKTLDVLRATAIKRTKAGDWTIYKGRGDTEPVGVPRDSANVEIRKWFGITIDGHRGHPIDVTVPGPRVSKAEDDPTVTVIEMWADGYCARTGERVEGLYLAIRSDDDFIGRQRKTDDGGHWTTLQDMQASARTSLDGKVTRILSGLRKVPVSELEKNGVDWKKSHLGSGFGTGAAREAGKVADADAGALVQKLKEEMLRRAGGDLSAMKQLSLDITGNPPKFKGFDDVGRLTQGWQIEAAMKKLRAHPVFGDAQKGSAPAAGQREPGAEG
jgi:hypothetical protein